ncbi:MAG: hypothetical protein ACYS7M_06205 [Planctomycetota bacterium]|jgi:hypothetical protein
MSVNPTIFRSGGNSENLRTQFNALRAQVAALNAAIDGINAKLDADTGVTDTNYAALWNPAADTSQDLTDR